MTTSYEYKKEGTIIAVNNFKFENNSLDHAWNSGRLCLVLFTDDECEYVVSITSKVKENYRDKYYYIDDKNFMFYYKNRYIESALKTRENKRKNHGIIKNEDKRNNVNGYIDLRKVYKIPIAYRDEVGKINYEDYKDILNKVQIIQNLKSYESIKENSISRI